MSLPELPEDWHVVVPIENLKISRSSLKIGPVRLVRFTKSRVSRLRRMERGMFVGNPHYAQDKKTIDRLTSRLYELTKDWSEKTCAEVSIRGTLEDAKNEAMNVVQEALNVIKLYRYHNDDFYSRYFGVPGTVVPNVLRNVVTFNTLETRVILSSAWIGHLSPFEVDAERIKFMRRCAFENVASLVTKHQRTQVEDRIAAAVQWFGKAFDVSVAEHIHARPFEVREHFELKGIHPNTLSFFDRFVKLMICAETLFIIGREPLRSAISERAALLLGKTYDQRRDVKKFFLKMYDKRSDLLHGRKLAMDADELSKLVLYLQFAIIRLVKIRKREKLTKDNDLYDWFERKKLGG